MSDPDVDASRWTRRSFIAGGSALLSAVVLGSDLAPMSDGLGVLAASKGPQIALGYVEGSSAGSSLESMLAAGRVRVVPATRVGAGSSVRGSTAVSVAGFSPQASVESSALQWVSVDTLIPSPVRGQSASTIPFYAFSSRAKPAPMTSTPSRFLIRGGNGLRVGFGLSTSASTGVSSSATTVLTSGRERALPKLREGIYLLGLRPGMWEQETDLPSADDPAWAALGSVVVTVAPATVV